MYYIWHIYFRYFGHPVAHLFVHIPPMLQKFCIFSGHLPKHQGSFCWTFQTLQDTCTYGIFHFRYFRHSVPHLFLYILLMLQKYSTFQDNYLSTRTISFGYFRHSWGMYYICTCGWHIYFGSVRHSAL